MKYKVYMTFLKIKYEISQNHVLPVSPLLLFEWKLNKPIKVFAEWPTSIILISEAWQYILEEKETERMEGFIN